MFKRGLVFAWMCFNGVTYVFPNGDISSSSATSVSKVISTGGKTAQQTVTGAPSPRPSNNKHEGKLKCVSHEIEIPNLIKESLKKWDSDFVVWKSSEYSPLMCSRVHVSSNLALNAITGDFNNDGIADAVVVGHNNTHEFLVAVVSQKDSTYRSIPLCSSVINSTLLLDEADGCILLGLTGDADFGLKSFPRLALYKKLSPGTKVDVFSGYSEPYVFKVESEAFIVGHIDQNFIRNNGAYQTKLGQIVTDPFDAFRMGWWNLRQGTGAAWEEINTSKYKFRLWDIHSISDDSQDFTRLKW